jgi:crotonobetainyl-CoA:carnitine CoA-transferase CaiB-like acyl-CoA transferase
MTVYPDHVAGRVGVIGTLALLIRRLRTGRGGTVSVAQSEVMLNHMATQIAAVTAVQDGLTLENGPERDAPWGVFPCAGEDEWCVVTVRGDADWAALCEAIERPDLAADPGLADHKGRDAQRARIDEALTVWLAKHRPRDAMAQLQTAGIPTGCMLRAVELPEAPQFVDRRFFRLMKQNHLEEPIYLENAPVRSQRLADPPIGSAPILGEHSREVIQEWLGLDEAAIEALVEAKVLETPEESVASV